MQIPKTIERGIPILRPRFTPPAFLHYMRRDVTPAIIPEYAYISAFTAIHPVFYPAELVSCPQCGSSEILWDGWNATGARNVYGVRMNERALGYQLRCKDCKTNKAPGGSYCFATTSCVFWEKWEHWKIPSTSFALLNKISLRAFYDLSGSIPYFLKRSAVTHELFDLIIELRPSSTSAGLAENLKRTLHSL